MTTVVMVGASGSGKTSLASTMRYGPGLEPHQPTIGAAMQFLQIGGQSISLFDTAGMEKHEALVPLYYRHADCVVLVFALDSEMSFEKAQWWFDEVRKTNTSCKIVLTGSKCDLRTRVDLQQAMRFAMFHKIDFRIVSAVSGEGVAELLKCVADAPIGVSETEWQSQRPVCGDVHKSGATRRGCCQ